jgi:hypothetical protein
MKKLDPSIIRIDDCVQIANPEVFVRVGYPLDFYDEFEQVEKQYRGDVVRFISSTCGGGPLRIGDVTFEQVVTKCLRAITYLKIKEKNFGGRERRIFTEQRREFEGQVCSVEGAKFVKTGTYVPGCRTSYEYEDYEPPYLSKEKTHKILKLTHNFETFWIEAKNVKKIQEDPQNK